MEQILMATDVNIKTSTVEVKVMKIGNRQVTLAVFRQLPEEPIIHPDTGKLRGIPWGRVNYHVDCDEMGVDHLHVIWEKDRQLRRSTVPMTYLCTATWQHLHRQQRYAAIDYVFARSLEGVTWLDKDGNTYQGNTIYIESHGQRILADGLLNDAKTLWNTPESLQKAQKELDGVLSNEEYASQEWRVTMAKDQISRIHFAEQKARESLTRTIMSKSPDRPEYTEDGSFPSSDQIQQTLDQITLKLITTERAWTTSYSQLEQLDQLFIAV